MPETDELGLLTEAAKAAGEIARRHFRQGTRSWDKGAGQGPVSAADLEIDAMLRARLLQARPGFGWLSEESAASTDRLSAPATFVIDPIDGTRAFLAGEQGFAHALAVVRGGRTTTAVVHLPMLEQTYSAELGRGAWLNGQPLAIPLRQGLEGARILAARPQLAPELWPGGLPRIERHFRASLAWRLCLVAEGAFDAMLTLRDTWDWDIAAASLIAAEAGAKVTDKHGAALRFNTAPPKSPGILAGSEAIVEDMLTRL